MLVFRLLLVAMLAVLGVATTLAGAEYAARPRAAGQVYYKCSPIDEVDTDRWRVPHYLPGTNTELNMFAKGHNVPLEAALGGTHTMYPEVHGARAATRGRHRRTCAGASARRAAAGSRQSGRRRRHLAARRRSSLDGHRRRPQHTGADRQ